MLRAMKEEREVTEGCEGGYSFLGKFARSW